MRDTHSPLVWFTIHQLTCEMYSPPFLPTLAPLAYPITIGTIQIVSKIRHKHVSVLLLVAFLIYSSVSTTVFETFAPDSLDDGNTYVRADYQLLFTTKEHRMYQAFAGAMILVYPVGIPLSLAVWLYRYKNTLKTVDYPLASQTSSNGPFSSTSVRQHNPVVFPVSPTSSGGLL